MTSRLKIIIPIIFLMRVYWCIIDVLIPTEKGGPEHQGIIDEITQDLESRGYTVQPEYRVLTPGGYKNTRYLVLYATNGYDSFGIQVGRMTKSGFPVSREQKAIIDIHGTGIGIVFIPYN